jgi:hypothetical protein
MSFLVLIYAHYERFVGTVKYTGRYLQIGTKVALKDCLAIEVPCKRSIRAGHYTCPTPDTLFQVNTDHAAQGVSVHSAGKATINTPRLGTLATLNGKGDLHIPFDTHAGHRTWSLFLERLDQVLGLGLLHAAIDLTQATANADLFLHIYPFHARNTITL